jgi:hypothetical protein
MRSEKPECFTMMCTLSITIAFDECFSASPDHSVKPAHATTAYAYEGRTKLKHARNTGFSQLRRY